MKMDIQLVQDDTFSHYTPPLSTIRSGRGDESVAMDEVSGVIATNFGENFGWAPLEPTPIGGRGDCKVVVVPEVPVHQDHKLLKSEIAPDLILLLGRKSRASSGRVNNRKIRCRGDDELLALMRSSCGRLVPSSSLSHSNKKRDNASTSSFSMTSHHKNKKMRIDKNCHLGVSHSKDTVMSAGLLPALPSVPSSASVGICTSTAEQHGTRSQEDETDLKDIEGCSSSSPLLAGCGVQTQKWYMRYKALLAFKAANGHCCVPNVYPPNAPLAQWVKRQRYQYKLKLDGQHSTVTEEREKALENIGFVWDSHSAAWMERFEELSAYRTENGHSNVPSNHPPNRHLSIWVKCQRRQYRLYRMGNPRSNMTPERIAKLESLDFSFNPRNL